MKDVFIIDGGDLPEEWKERAVKTFDFKVTIIPMKNLMKNLAAPHVNIYKNNFPDVPGICGIRKNIKNLVTPEVINAPVRQVW